MTTRRTFFLWAAFVKGASTFYWTVGIATVAFGGSVLGASLVVWKRPVIGAVASIAVVALMLLDGAFRLWREERQLVGAAQSRVAELEEAPRPHLVFTGTDHAQASVISQFGQGGTGAPGAASTSAAGSQTAFSSYRADAHDFVRVFVANDPPTEKVGTTALSVVGHVSFIAPNGIVAIDRMLGRWAEAPQRIETGRLGISLDEVQIDIDPNGLPHPLDIAMKRARDSSLYAINDDNASAPDFCLPKHELTETEYTVRVSIRGSNTGELIAEFLLRNEGIGKSLVLTPSESPE